ncbi:hypothetical protein FOXG_10827 [Fusarium oxysporum f. sp. lycopersici 4287]|uniref:chitinase n=1 Tax=Fusarium oxysporum f. sp. lycopersici (strain 4287 / CBS 123668 / FGSC 9935 / NRRL 34936) TaxID=426428 RepID=A0A0J9VHS0_FUSO4|nr:hypothetical protein FOXG_10827 [Fusarium oxysporum f. sp. lycopersici 4287]KNB10683.1 hypothetical protein FOXG_10827 [Fusarium oxysporum f. sp. lycopersici 4287]
MSQIKIFLLFASPGLLLSLSLSLVQAQVSVANGVSVYQGTTVSQNQHGIPTLAYNCAKVPASCENVHQQYPLATTVHAAPAGAVTGHHTILGARSHLQLHFDRNDNIGGQRGKACAKSWKNHHNCPESNQPDTVPSGAMLGDDSFPAARWNPNNLVMGDAGYNRIANAAGQFSGNSTNPARQAYKDLPKGPPLPILEIAQDFVEEQKEDKPAEEPYIVRAVKASDGNESSIVEIEDSKALTPRAADTSGWMHRRQSKRQCDFVTPCPDGSCCNRKRQCGYGEEVCGSKVCVSNCDATAACGKDSLGGKVKCPLNVCCSAYGYCGVEDDFCRAGNADNSCQKGFGSCTKIEPPSCGGRSAFARSIGYYQFANVRERQCNRITPKQIRTEGFTHFLARRARFIKSLTSFLDENGFQGVELDWEYPGAPDRGGRKEDTDNYVSLLKDMRAAFGSKYGISIAIHTSYWYLRWFKSKEIEQYVDYMGIMTYDLHGPWDHDVKQVGRVILGHTNIPEIANWSLPLYYAGVDPAKVNMGLAYYARGYTVADSNCNGVGCKWSGTSRPAPCTNFGGVMSLEEIERMVKDEPGISPKLLPKDMMMELKFGNQWIGYDNKDTIYMKKKWASSRCFGGTMVWSVDMFSGSGSGDTPDDQSDGGSEDPGGGQGDGSGVIYIDPEIWEVDQPEVKCHPPCTMVLPPSSLKKPVTLTLPPYETSLDVAWSGKDGWHSTVQKTTLTPLVVTVTTVDVWHITIREDRTKLTTIWSTFDITPSIKVPTFIITNRLPETTKDSVTQPPGTKTITPPPYPWTYTPPTTRPSNTPGDDDDDDDEVIPPFPVVTWRPGSLVLYARRTAASHGGGDFADPRNPKPPKRPVPPNPTIPKPTGKPVKPTKIPTPGTTPENKEHEDNERQCAIEFGLPLPTWRDPATTTSVKPKPTPPKPSPKPDPKPPSPNPKTEEVKCYGIGGAWIHRALVIEALEDFCDRYEGQVLDAAKPETERTLECQHGVVCTGDGFGCVVNVLMSVTVKNGCRFTVGGKGPKSECGRILRRMIDECDASDVRYKKGGTMSSNCADWKFDPNYRGWWSKNQCSA